ncbi:MAG: hypothetical protein H6Q96_961, partial [Nitrospirae bacterium]|nr:hypothetical protein [Nitrospirota bacterium]
AEYRSLVDSRTLNQAGSLLDVDCAGMFVEGPCGTLQGSWILRAVYLLIRTKRNQKLNREGAKVSKKILNHCCKLEGVFTFPRVLRDFAINNYFPLLRRI